MIYADASMVDLEPDSSYAVTGIYSFGRGLISRPVIRGSETAYQRMARLKTGQIVMSKLNAWEGGLAVVGEDFSDTYVSPEYPVFSVDEKRAQSAYVKHLLAWPRLWGRLTPRGSMVQRKRTTPATFLATCVPLPDPVEQNRIAGRLDAAMHRIAQVDYLKGTSNNLILQYADALFRSIKQTAPLAEVLLVDDKFVDVESDSTYPVTGICSFGRDLIRRPVIQGSGTAYTRFVQIQAGQIVMSKLNAWEGALAVVGGDFADTYVSPEYPVFSLIESAADSEYLEHLLAWPELWARLTPRGSMFRRKRTTPATLLATEVPLPSLSEQRRIAKQLTLARRVAEGSAAQVEQLATLRRALLDAAFSGRL
ncbi:hypothetical protein [Streptomyces griseoflavus]|nr:hypothetical protein [Streptomyces griseoflavus]